MAFAKPPTYGTTPKKKPRLVQQAVGAVAPKPMGAIAAPRAAPGWKKPTSANPLAPSAPIATVNPTLQSVPQIGGGPPPATADATSDRIAAREGYTNTMGQVNQGIREAAQKYGGASQITQFGYDPQGTDTTTAGAGILNDPLSATATIDRNYGAQAKASRENANAQNTFFSSNQLGDQQNLVDDRGRQIEQARRDYETAVNQLTQQLIAARGSRGESFRMADAADKAAQLAPDPVAEGPTPWTPEQQAYIAAVARQQDAGAAPAPAAWSGPTQATGPGFGYQGKNVVTKKKPRNK